MNEQIERDELLGLYSDMFKDANGFRPTGCLWPDALSNEEIQAKLDNLQEDIRRQIEEERYAEEEEAFAGRPLRWGPFGYFRK